MRVRTNFRPVALAIVGSFLAGIVVVALPSLSDWPLIWLGGAAVVAPFAIVPIRRRIDPFDPVYLFASTYAVLFVVRPAVDLLDPGGIPMIQGLSPSPTFQLALLVSLIGLLSFYLGYYVPLGVGVGRLLPLPTAQLTKGLVTWGVLLTAVVGAIAYSLFLISSGGLTALTTLLAGRSQAEANLVHASSGYLYTGPLWVTGPAILLLATTPRWGTARGIAGLALLAVSEMVNAAEGNRSWVLVVAAMVFVLWYARRGRRPSAKAIIVGITVVFLVGVVALAQYRDVEGRSGSLADTVSATLANPAAAVTGFFQSPDTQMIDDFAIEIRFIPGLVSHTYGQTYLNDLGAPVPRSLWPTKPIDGDSQLMVYVWPVLAAGGVGFSFSMFGEPYLNFGIIGVALFCAFMGAAWRALYEWFKRAPDSPAAIAIFAISWPFLLVYVWGGFGVSYPRQAIALIPAVLIIGVAELRHRRTLHWRSSSARSELVR